MERKGSFEIRLTRPRSKPNFREEKGRSPETDSESRRSHIYSFGGDFGLGDTRQSGLSTVRSIVRRARTERT